MPLYEEIVEDVLCMAYESIHISTRSDPAAASDSGPQICEVLEKIVSLLLVFAPEWGSCGDSWPDFPLRSALRECSRSNFVGRKTTRPINTTLQSASYARTSAVNLELAHCANIDDRLAE